MFILTGITQAALRTGTRKWLWLALCLQAEECD